MVNNIKRTTWEDISIQRRQVRMGDQPPKDPQKSPTYIKPKRQNWLKKRLCEPDTLGVKKKKLRGVDWIQQRSPPEAGNDVTGSQGRG